MSDIAIKFEEVSKQYRLGVVGTGTLSHDLNRWWHVVRGKEDPYLKIGETNDRSAKAMSDYVWALKDITFDVKQGDVVGIIGKNGAGKSTLLKLLSRVTSPTLGTIKAKGRIASLLEVGTGFHPEMTGRENIYMNGAIMGMTKAEITRKLDEIIDFAGVEKYIDTPVKRYSSGMTVRLGFAIAAYLEPEILVVDEVLAVGDAEFQKKAIGKMQDVSQRGGRTVLFVSHNMAAVEKLCNNGIVLENGTVAFNGKIADSIDFYLQRQKDRSSLELSQIKRNGNGLIRISEVYFLDSNDIRRDSYLVGESMKIVVKYTTEEGFRDISSSRIDIGVNDIYGTRAMWLSSSIFTSRLEEDKDTLIFNIAELSLVEGSYNLNLFAETTFGISDHLTDILSFSVGFGDYYGSGKSIPNRQGHLVAKYNITQL